MEKTKTSRLLQMQARFQQKQMQERELKITSLYEAQQARALDRVRQSPANGAANGATNGAPGASPQEPAVPIHPGKVRQMFEERRTKAGIDKSYPLQPIHNTDKGAQRRPLPNGFSKVTAKVNGVSKTTTNTVEKKMSSRTVVIKKAQQNVTKSQKTQINNSVNGAGDLNHNHEKDFNHVKRSFPKSNGEVISHTDELDKADNNYLLENETFPEALALEPSPRSPEPREQPQKSPEPREPKRPPRRSPTNKISHANAHPPPVAPPRRSASESKPSTVRSPIAQTSVHKPVAATSSPRKMASAAAGRAATADASAAGPACTVCGRHFAPDRIEKHQEICRKAANKKRKPFDALKHRLAGTEAEQYISKLRKNTKPNTVSTTKVQPINNNWRQKHNDFINAIRAAKQVQAHLDAGGKLSDLPPPPPSENPDYVQCPHCKRRFNEAAAERHIPKCANYQYNKGSQPPKGRR